MSCPFCILFNQNKTTRNENSRSDEDQPSTDVDFNEILKRFPELGPRPLIYHENWTTTYMTEEIVKQFVLQRFATKYGKRVTNFIPYQTNKCKMRKQSKLDRFILGNYDFLYDHQKICHCGKGSAIPEHVLSHCEHFREWKRATKERIAANELNSGWMLTKQENPRVQKLLWAMVRHIGHAKNRE